MVLSIEKADYIEGYKIKLTFSDSVSRTIDFGLFLRHAQNPMIRKYLDIDEFKKFKIEFGDLHWNDYELCFPIIDLYEDNLLKPFISNAA